MQMQLGRYQVAVDKRLAAMAQARFSERFWARDPTLWKDDPAHAKVIRNRMGWLESADAMAREVGALRALADQVRGAGLRRAVLLGMGGSSLCPEVLAQTFGAAGGFLDLHVLDSTSPEAVGAVEQAVDLQKTLFLVSTKSGTTTETLSLYRYFAERVRAAAVAQPGAHFVAITDPDTPLQKLATSEKFRRTFLNPADIGGRYSALSYFGLVPAALLGMDLHALLAPAQALAARCGARVPPAENTAFVLGAALGELGLAGRDKVTFVLSEALAPFGAWVEQLIAESTGKEGKGLLPVDAEPLGAPPVYDVDRVFVSIRTRGEPEDAALGPIGEAHHPIIRIEIPDRSALGGEFWRWEVATAVASAVEGVDPFDEPNVTEAKDTTKEVLAQFQREGRLPEEPALAGLGPLRVYAGPQSAARLLAAGADAVALLRAHLRSAAEGDYVALCAYLHRTPDRHALLAQLRRTLRDRLERATTLGYGPRFLHSTGQMHKGGPATGVFLQITAPAGPELPIPGEPYGFGTLLQAQALGDLRVLDRRGRRALRVDLGGDIRVGLQELAAVVESACVT